MAIPTSSSSSIAVDLGEAADLDDATSKLFFSESSAAGPALSWPAVSEVKSTLARQGLLVALCSKHGVPSELTPVCADHLGWRACATPPVGSNKICVYSAALDAGLRFPLHPFYVRVLSHYRLAPSQLTPNAWTFLAAFVLLCEDAGVQPLVSAFRWFFAIYAHKHRGEPTGHHHFQPLRRLFTGTSNLPQRSGWKSSFFVLDCPSGWDCPVRWGKPKRADARRVQLTDTVIEKLNQKVKQMGCIDIKVFLANREMPVGDLATLTPMQSAVKAEAGAAVGAAAESASTRKRSRLSSSAVLSQPQTLPTSPPPYLAPIQASSTGGRSGHIPPPDLAPIRASSTGGHSGHFPPPQQQSFGESTPVPPCLAPIRASSTGGRSGHIPPPGLAPIRASSTGGRSGHFPPPQQQSFWESTPSPPCLAPTGASLPPHPWSFFGLTPPAPQELPGMTARARAASIGEDEVTPQAPQTMCASDALMKLWEATAKVGEQEAVIANLNQELHLMKTWNARCQMEREGLAAHLDVATDDNNHLKEKLARVHDHVISHLRMASDEVAQLKAVHAADVARLEKKHAAEKAQLKEELAAKNAQLKEKLRAERFHRESYDMGVNDMMQLTLTLHEGVVSPDKLKQEAKLLVDSLDIEDGDAKMSVSQ